MTSVPAPAPHPAPPERPELPAGVEPSDVTVGWRPWTAPASLFAAFGVTLCFGLIVGIVAAIGGADLNDPPPWVSIVSTIFQDAALIGSALLFARTVARPRPWQFGLRRVRIRPALGWALLLYLVFVLFSYAWLSAVGATDTKDNIVDDLGAKNSAVALVAVTFLVTVCAPLAEEFFFRGYFFGALRSMGLWPAALLTGLTFGLVHVAGSPIAFLVPLAFLGMALALLRERTGSLYPGIVVHCVNNALAMGANEGWTWETPLVLAAALAVIAGLVWLGLRAWERQWPGRTVAA